MTPDRFHGQGFWSRVARRLLHALVAPPRPGQGRRLLILAPYFPPENTSGAARPDRFARYLREIGWTVGIVARTLDDTDSARPEVTRVSDRGAGPISRLLAWVQRWLLPYDERLPWSTAAAGAVRTRWRDTPVEMILSTQPPAAAHIAGMLLKAWSGALWVADFRDPLWGNPFRTRRRTRLLDPWLEWLIVNRADAIIANTDAMADLFRTRYRRQAAKVHLIWNGYDPGDGLVPLPPSARRQRVICHVGTLYGGRTPSPVAHSLARLLRGGALSAGSFLLQLVGPADAGLVDVAHEPYATLMAAGCLAFDGVRVHALQARAEMLAADILLLLDNNASNAGLQVPAKLFDYVRAERPILAVTAHGSPSSRLLAMSGVPFASIAPEDPPDRLDHALLGWITAPPAPAAMSEAFRVAFDGAAQAVTLGAILDGLQSPKDDAGRA